MIDKNTILSFDHYKKGKPFTGSHTGMRYRIVREKAADEDDIDRFRVDTWPEPLSYEATDEDKIRTQRFVFDQEGYEALIAYLNDCISEYLVD
jgi:hypothetical protein